MSTFEEWTELLWSSRSPGEVLDVLHVLETRDPRMLVRILTNWKTLPVTTDKRVMTVRAGILWKFYTGELPWHDPDNVIGRSRFQDWLFENALKVFDSDPGFLRLWEEGGRENDALTMLVASLHPDRAAEILKAALDKVGRRGSRPSIHRRLLREHFPAEWPHLRDWLWRYWELYPDRAPVDDFFFELIRHPDGRPAMRELVQDPRFDKISSRDLEIILQQLNPILNFPRYHETRLSNYYYNADLDKNIRDEAFAKAHEAMRACLEYARQTL